jgi:NAD(P)H-hydrate epimerase
MIPVYSGNELKAWDEATLAHEKIKLEDLMDRACNALLQAYLHHLNRYKRCVVVAGMGNNGGDGFCLAYKLSQLAYQVEVIAVKAGESRSEANQWALALCESANIPLHFEADPALLPTYPADVLLIDALIGVGWQPPIRASILPWITYINTHKGEKLALDLPSGLSADQFSVSNAANIVKADYCFTLGGAKKCLFFPETAIFAGEIHWVNFRLSEQFKNENKPWAYLLQEIDFKGVLPKRSRFSHKGQFGHALLIAGQKNMAGAALLAAEAAYRTGVGKVSVQLPNEVKNALYAYLPEAMPLEEPASCWSTLHNYSGYSALGIGPGLGQANATGEALKELLMQAPGKLVIDADAINLLAKNHQLLPLLPNNCILTPHKAEFDRLCAKSFNQWHERLAVARQFAQQYQVILILKNAYSFICLPDGRLYINSSGDAAMAKAGSGDVLTGILTGLLARGLTPEKASLLGVWLHGKAAEFAVKKTGQESLLARDINAAIGQVLTNISH